MHYNQSMTKTSKIYQSITSVFNGIADLFRRTESKQSRFEIVFCALWIMVILYSLVRPLSGDSGIVSLIWVPSILVFFLASIRRKVHVITLIELLIPASIMIVSVLAQARTIERRHLIAAFCYINMFLTISACTRVKPTKRTIDLIYYACVFLTLLFFVYSFTPIGYRVHTEGVAWTCKYLAFDLGNSNSAAMFIMSFYCVLLINLPIRKNKVFVLLLLALNLYLIIQTNCRSVLISVIIISVVYLLVSKKRIPVWTMIITMLFPALFIGLYLFLYNQFGNQSIVLFEKTLFSGRQDIYTDYLSHINSGVTLLFGNFFEVCLQNGHNIVVTIVSSLGFVGLVGFYGFFIRTIILLCGQKTTITRTVSLICIMGLFLQSSMESAFFTGGFPMIVFLATLVLLCNYDPHNAELLQSNNA